MPVLIKGQICGLSFDLRVVEETNKCQTKFIGHNGSRKMKVALFNAWCRLKVTAQHWLCQHVGGWPVIPGGRHCQRGWSWAPVIPRSGHCCSGRSSNGKPKSQWGTHSPAAALSPPGAQQSNGLGDKKSGQSVGTGQTASQEKTQKERRQEQESRLCIICRENPKGAAILPCYHCNVCLCRLRWKGHDVWRWPLPNLSSSHRCCETSLWPVTPSSCSYFTLRLSLLNSLHIFLNSMQYSLLLFDIQVTFLTDTFWHSCNFWTCLFDVRNKIKLIENVSLSSFWCWRFFWDMNWDQKNDFFDIGEKLCQLFLT